MSELVILALDFAIIVVSMVFFGFCTRLYLKKNGFYKKRWFLLGAFCSLLGGILLCIILEDVLRERATVTVYFGPHNYDDKFMSEVWHKEVSYVLSIGSTIGGLLGEAIALCIVAISKKRKKIWEQRWKKCPACAEKVKAEAKVCRFCGHSFE